MQSWWLPPLEFSLWPCAILLIIFVPISIHHERNWRRTLAQYAEARREAGADDGEWPPPGAAMLMGVQPWLVFAVAGILAAATLLGLALVLAWPHRVPGFSVPLNYFDRPYMWCMIVAGTAAVVGAVALGIDVVRSPWAAVAHQVRRSMYGTEEMRAARFSAALLVDPGVPRR